MKGEEIDLIFRAQTSSEEYSICLQLLIGLLFLFYILAETSGIAFTQGVNSLIERKLEIPVFDVKTEKSYQNITSTEDLSEWLLFTVD